MRTVKKYSFSQTNNIRGGRSQKSRAETQPNDSSSNINVNHSGDCLMIENNDRASFLIPYCVSTDEVLVAVQVNPKHGFHLIGGKQENGEDAKQCLDRELQEELGAVGSLLANKTFDFETDVFFEVMGREMTAALYALEMSIQDFQNFIYCSGSEREFRLAAMELDASIYERETVSEAATVALDWLTDTLSGSSEKVNSLDVIFDFDKQAWFTAAGERLEEEPEWVFPCPSCHGPSDCVGTSSYYERYECLNCGNRFTVE